MRALKNVGIRFMGKEITCLALFDSGSGELFSVASSRSTLVDIGTLLRSLSLCFGLMAL